MHSLAWKRFRITLVHNWHDAEHKKTLRSMNPIKLLPVCTPLWVDHKMTRPMLNNTISNYDVRPWLHSTMCYGGSIRMHSLAWEAFRINRVEFEPLKIFLIYYSNVWAREEHLVLQRLNIQRAFRIAIVTFEHPSSVWHYYTNVWTSEKRLALPY